MKLVTRKITRKELNDMAKDKFGNLVKAVVDTEKGVMVVDAELHADEEAFLLESGSLQSNLWGINLYPENREDEFIEFDSMINLRPGDNNFTRSVDSENVRKSIAEIVNKLVEL